ncbi:MAG: aspartate aminotransferase family protein [Bacteroidota bacterium]
MSLKTEFLTYLAQTSPQTMGLEVERAEGVYLIGPDGRKTIDFISGICVNNLGHGVPEVVEAVQQQAAKSLHAMVYGEVIQSPQVQYAKALSDVLDDRLNQVYFVNSGAEAIEASLKVAKRFTGREEIVTCHNAYHGSTHGALSVSGNPESKKGYGPLLPKVRHIRFNSFEDLAHITAQTAAFVVEAIQGAGGVILPQPGYLQAARDRCTETGTLLIMDEIQTGFGRTGSLFAHQHFGVVPDVLVLAKALGGGMPIGAFITDRDIFSVIQKDPVLGHITTFGGHPVCCAAGLAAFQKLQQDRVLERIPRLEKVLREHLQHPAMVELRGIGMLYALQLNSYEEASQVRAEAQCRGLLTIGFLNIPDGLRMCPPLTITEKELIEGCNILKASMDTLQ